MDDWKQRYFIICIFIFRTYLNFIDSPDGRNNPICLDLLNIEKDTSKVNAEHSEWTLWEAIIIIWFQFRIHNIPSWLVEKLSKLVCDREM